MSLVIREELPGDAATIGEITKAAFDSAPHASHTEHLIVEALRQSNQLTFSLVGVLNGTIVGQIAISPVSITNGAVKWYGIGPISVLPAHQRCGIGSQLIVAGIGKIKSIGGRGCVVLGDPKFYRRFGFVSQNGLEYPGVPQEYFQALLLLGAMPVGRVQYHASFDIDSTF